MAPLVVLRRLGHLLQVAAAAPIFDDKIATPQWGLLASSREYGGFGLVLCLGAGMCNYQIARVPMPTIRHRQNGTPRFFKAHVYTPRGTVKPQRKTRAGKSRRQPRRKVLISRWRKVTGSSVSELYAGSIHNAILLGAVRSDVHGPSAPLFVGWGAGADHNPSRGNQMSSTHCSG